jgi:hypothetical protein
MHRLHRHFAARGYIAPMRLLVLAAVTAACSSGPGGSAGGAVAGAIAGERALEAGTVLRLPPVEVVVGELPEGTGPWLNGLLREALRQSARLDFASGVEDTPIPQELRVQLDATATSLTSTLHWPGQAPLPLASASGPDLPSAIDALAIATRHALGDPCRLGVDGALPVALIYTGQARCAEHTEAALVESARGNSRSALSLLRSARIADPGCTLTLCLLAEAQLDLGEAEAAAKTAQEALRYDERLAPTTEHRLARALLLARGQRDLLELARVAAGERSHDPHVRYSQALAANLAGDFATAAPLLRDLQRRWPQSGPVGYHLTFAELGLGDARAGLAAIERSRQSLSRFSLVLPRSLALYHDGRHAELQRYLEETAADPAVQKSPLQHEILRMQAAQAVLAGREEAAVHFLLQDLEWIRQRQSRLSELALDLAEDCEVLLRLRRGAELRPRLRAIAVLGRPPQALQQVLTYVEGRLAIEEGGEAKAAAAMLDRESHPVFGSLLRAAVHHKRGELWEEGKELANASLATDDALVHASLAVALRRSGKEKEAVDVLAELKLQLLKIDLRDPRRHALLSPGRALALLACE